MAQQSPEPDEDGLITLKGQNGIEFQVQASAAAGIVETRFERPDGKGGTEEVPLAEYVTPRRGPGRPPKE